GARVAGVARRSEGPFGGAAGPRGCGAAELALLVEQAVANESTAIAAMARRSRWWRAGWRMATSISEEREQLHGGAFRWCEERVDAAHDFEAGARVVIWALPRADLLAAARGV